VHDGRRRASSSDAGEPLPANYRQIVAVHVRTTFLDPYSVRDASIAPPRAGSLSRPDIIWVERGWIVCLRANAKNRMGGYTGLTTSAMLVRAGAVVTSHSGEDHYEVRTSCADARYEPFPEIEAGGQGQQPASPPRRR
jgi:hypothetical protein